MPPRRGRAVVARHLDEVLTITHGPKAAAWLVRRFRRTLRQFGIFRVEIPVGRTRPQWFDLALKAFGRRPHVWSVVEVARVGLGGTRVSVRWLLWPRAPWLPRTN